MITFVSHTNKPGGGELALRRFLEATSLRVRLVTLEPDGVWLGLDVEVVHARGVNGLRQALRGGDLVVANSMRAAFLTALVLPRGGRLVYWVRDGLTDSAMSPLALGLTKHVTARRTGHYIANSDWTAGTVREALGVDNDQVHVVHSMSGGKGDVPQRPRTRTHDPLRLLFLGRVTRWKAPDVAVRALGILREHGVAATVTIAGGVHFGEDDYATELRKMVDVEPAATMIGHVDDVQELLDRHDILVHCSIVPEPFGQVIVQGLLAGLPVVATDGGGPREILASATPPLTYPPGDPQALAQAVLGVLEDYEAVSRWALQRSAAYADPELAAHTAEVLGRLQRQ